MWNTVKKYSFQFSCRHELGCVVSTSAVMTYRLVLRCSRHATTIIVCIRLNQPTRSGGSLFPWPVHIINLSSHMDTHYLGQISEQLSSQFWCTQSVSVFNLQCNVMYLIDTYFVSAPLRVFSGALWTVLKLFRIATSLLYWTSLSKAWRLNCGHACDFGRVDEAVRWKAPCRKGCGWFVKLTWLALLSMYYIL